MEPTFKMATNEHDKVVTRLAETGFAADGRTFRPIEWRTTLGVLSHASDHISTGHNKGRCSRCADHPLVIKVGHGQYRLA